MTDRRVPAVVAGDADSLDDLLARLGAVGRTGAPVDLVVPRGSSLLLTAAEFRRLRDEVDRDRLGVTLRSDDPLRGQLAKLLGVAAGPIPPHVEDALARRAAEAAARVEEERSSRLQEMVPDRSGGTSTEPPNRSGGATAEPPDVSGTTASGLPAPPAPAPAPAQTPALDRLAKLSPPAAGSAAEGGAHARQAGTAGGDSGPGGPPPPTEPSAPSAMAPPAAAGVASTPTAADPAAEEIGTADGGWPEPPVAFPLPAPRQRKRLLGRRVDRPPLSPNGGVVVAEPSGSSTIGPADAEGSLAADSVAGAPPKPAGLSFAEVAARREKRSAPRRLTVAAAVIAILALVVAAGALLLPRATIAVTLERVPFQTDVTYDALVEAAPTEAGGIAVPATPVEVEVEVEETIPTTGRRVEPDGVAVAPVLFANPNPQPVTVAPETALGSLDGPDFVLVAAVEVPAADPATGAAGQAEGEARAAEPGGVGNVGVGEVGGRLESGVYYSNRNRAAEGGTDREVPVVAAADLAAIAAAADAAIAEAALAEAAGEAAAGSQAVPETMSVVAEDTVLDAAEGDAVDALSATATATVRLLVYDPDALASAIGERLPELAEVPVGRVLDPETVRFGAPVVESGSADGARLRVAVDGDAIVPFGPGERRALAERLAGGGTAAAESMLGAISGVESWQVAYSPGWLPPRMPGDPDRIEIEVSG